jgi:hypothetical protein
MATLIAFSAAGGDYILVDEELNEVAQRLSGGDAYVELTIVPSARQRFDPSSAFVNTARVAYIRTPAGGGV